MFNSSEICPWDQCVVKDALATLMESNSERIKRNARWVDDPPCADKVTSYEAFRQSFAMDYMAAVRAAGMC